MVPETRGEAERHWQPSHCALVSRGHHLITWDYRYCRGPGDRLHPTLAKAQGPPCSWCAGQLRIDGEEGSSGTEQKPYERKERQTWPKLGLHAGNGQKLAEDAEESKGKPHHSRVTAALPVTRLLKILHCSAICLWNPCRSRNPKAGHSPGRNTSALASLRNYQEDTADIHSSLVKHGGT